MEKNDIALPSMCFHVEKILEVASLTDKHKTYKVQWATSWVSENQLFGCKELIKQFHLKKESCMLDCINDDIIIKEMDTSDDQCDVNEMVSQPVASEPVPEFYENFENNSLISSVEVQNMTASETGLNVIQCDHNNGHLNSQSFIAAVKIEDQTDDYCDQPCTRLLGDSGCKLTQIKDEDNIRGKLQSGTQSECWVMIGVEDDGVSAGHLSCNNSGTFSEQDEVVNDIFVNNQDSNSIFDSHFHNEQDNNLVNTESKGQPIEPHFINLITKEEQSIPVSCKTNLNNSPPLPGQSSSGNGNSSLKHKTKLIVHSSLMDSEGLLETANDLYQGHSLIDEAEQDQNLPENESSETMLSMSGYNCKICGQVFPLKPYLSHMKAFHGKFACRVCSEVFDEKLSCQMHEIETHNINRPTCKVCGLKYSDPATLKIHMMRKHTKERPFHCSACTKTFCTSGDLLSHERVHTGERPFVCPYCNKKYTKSSGYHQHIRRKHTMDINFNCFSCGKGFFSKPELRKHVCKGSGTVQNTARSESFHN